MYFLDYNLLDKTKTVAVCAGAGTKNEFEQLLSKQVKTLIGVDVAFPQPLPSHCHMITKALVADGSAPELEFTYSGVYWSVDVGGKETKTFPTITLEQIQKEYGDIHVLKLDVEGAEYDIFDTLKSPTFEQITLEIHDFTDNHHTLEDSVVLIDAILGMGYSCVWSSGNDKVEMLRTTKHGDAHPLGGMNEFSFIRNDLNTLQPMNILLK
jgi:hypothetical protein